MIVAVILFCTKYTNEPLGITDHIELLLHGKVNGPPGIVKRGPIYKISQVHVTDQKYDNRFGAVSFPYDHC